MPTPEQEQRVENVRKAVEEVLQLRERVQKLEEKLQAAISILMQAPR
jgi:hypothetical protein